MLKATTGSALAVLALSSAFPAWAAEHPLWGLYARLAEGTWRSQLSTGETSVARYRWIKPYETLRAEHRLEGAPFTAEETITLGPQPGRLQIVTKENDRPEPTRSDVILRPDGSAVETFIGPAGNPERATYTPVDGDHYSARTEARIDGAWREIWSSEISRVRE